MDKLLLIVPPYLTFDNYVNPAFNERTVVKKSGNYGSLVTDMPIGLLSLSAYVKHHARVDVKLIDFNIVLNKLDTFDYNSFSDFFSDFLSADEWIEYQPTIIGISTLFTTSYYNMLDLSNAARELFPNALIIAGGGIPTNMYTEIFRDSASFDALCYGEGEKPLSGLLGSADREGFLKAHPSWITREKVESGESFKHDFVQNLDEIPFYDYALLNPSEYQISPTMKNLPSLGEKKHLFHFATSRGCVHHCCYCASHTVHGRKMRYHGAGRVREDLRRLRDEFGAETIGFQDDNFMADRSRAFNIINIAKDLKITFFFQSGLALYALDREMLENIKSAGINELVLPVESGSNRVLNEIMHKPINLSIAKRVIDDCRELGIDTDAQLLIGLPGETKSDIEDARAFLKTLNASWIRIYVATPLVGSEMFDTCVKNNYLQGSHIGCDFKKAVVNTEHFTADYIEEKAYFLNLELNFVLNSDFRLGNYDKALKGFENAIRVKDDHAFAFYFAARCCRMLDLEDKYLAYKARYREIVEDSEFWKGYANQFQLGALE